MSKNNINYYIKRKMITFIVIFIIQSLSFIVLYFLFRQYINEISIIKYILIFLILIYLLIVIIIASIIFSDIQKLKSLLDIKPIKCKIEDFVYIGYTDDGRRKYDIYPIVKNLEDNKLYFTYSSYALIEYNTIYSQMNNYLIDMKIYRSDKSKVEIGDDAYMYIKNNIDIKVDVNIEKNIVTLNKTKIYYKSDKYDIDIFKNLNYFEGIVDIERNGQ